MPRHTKDDAEIADRRKKVAALYLNRHDQTAIANLLDVDQSTISRDIKFLIKKWKISAEDDIKDYIARDLAELDSMEREAAANYFTAKTELKNMKQAKTWMETRLAIKDRRARLLILDKPQKVQVDANIKGELEGARELLQSTIAGIASRLRTEELLEQTEQSTGTSSEI